MTESIPSLIERIDAELEGVTFPDRRGEMLREARAELSRLTVPDPSTSAQDLSKGPLPAPACPKCGKDRVTTSQVKHRHCLDCGHDWTVTDSVSPLPEEIAGLAADLLAVDIDPFALCAVRKKSAAALQRLAEEAKRRRVNEMALGAAVQRRQDRINQFEDNVAALKTWREIAERRGVELGEMEEERQKLREHIASVPDGISKETDEIMMAQKARIAELEAERDWLAKRTDDLQTEANAIRAKTIEKCAKVADRESEAVDGGEYWIAARIAKRIRALNQPEAGGE